MQDEAITEAIRDCLIAVVNNDLDLKRFANEHWYRIPKRAVGRAVAADALAEATTLALYQTASIADGLSSAIELWGEIDERGEATRRALIPDEPNHPAADEEYHLIRLKNVERLAAPIVSRRPRRITFLRTTREHLLHAADINELILGTPAEEKLWRAIRDRDNGGDVERRYYMRMNGVVMEVDFALFTARPFGVHCRESQQEGAYHDAPRAWGILRFSPAQLESDLEGCLEQIAAMMSQMRDGGR